jgi:hypothetical protein
MDSKLSTDIKHSKSNAPDLHSFSIIWTKEGSKALSCSFRSGGSVSTKVSISLSITGLHSWGEYTFFVHCTTINREQATRNERRLALTIVSYFLIGIRLFFYLCQGILESFYEKNFFSNYANLKLELKSSGYPFLKRGHRHKYSLGKKLKN